jgi:hypothetical protein
MDGRTAPKGRISPARLSAASRCRWRLHRRTGRCARAASRRVRGARCSRLDGRDRARHGVRDRRRRRRPASVVAVAAIRSAAVTLRAGMAGRGWFRPRAAAGKPWVRRVVTGFHKPRAKLHVHELVLERVAHELGARAATQLVLDVRPVYLDRPCGEEELLADLGVGVAEREQSQHFDLAIREVIRRPCRFARQPGEGSAEPGIEVGPPRGEWPPAAPRRRPP